tara:strand:- start:1604 stop:1768 length:165 start_codon:yes stop_codon:yes gene_type:complete
VLLLIDHLKGIKMQERLRKEAEYWKEEALRYRFLFRFLFVYLIFDLLIHFDLLK